MIADAIFQPLANLGVRIVFALSAALDRLDTRLCSRTANNPDAEADL